MATNNRGGNRGGKANRGRNNNPAGTQPIYQRLDRHRS